MATRKTIEGFATDRTELVNQLIAQIEADVLRQQEQLYRKLIDEFLDKLDIKDGIIQNTTRNKRMLQAIDTVFAQHTVTAGVRMVKSVVEGVEKLMDFNLGYFAALEPDAELDALSKQLRLTMREWLGISDGGIIKNGYLDKVVSDSAVRNQVRDLVVKDIISQQGYARTKAKLQEFIQGSRESTGALQKYYRNFVYDTYSVTDRVAQMEFATARGYDFAIYEGGLILTTRKFCRERNGKVFHRSEIAKWNPTEARPPQYNPFTDLGGYGCRHHLNWIPNALAIELRPDAKRFLKSAA